MNKSKTCAEEPCLVERLNARQAGGASLCALSEGAVGMEKIEELPASLSIRQKVIQPFSAASAARGGRVVLSSLVEYVFAVFSTLVELSLGILSILARGINRKDEDITDWSDILRHGITGMLVAVSLLWLLSGLFCSAGQVFKHDAHELLIRPKVQKTTAAASPVER